MNLIKAPKGKLLKIIQIDGNKKLMMKLSIQNIYIDDIIIKLNGAILGPVSIQKVKDNSKIAIGKDIASIIFVEEINEDL
jgi:Fe2+ transport system protein FeoA